MKIYKSLLRGLFAVISIAVLVLYVFLMKESQEVDQHILAFNNKELVVEIADNVLTRTQGLSGRESLPEGEGLLFVFDNPGQYGFWMKDMKFPIDIYWFDDSMTLVGVSEDLYPDSFPEKFYPNEPVQYVLETNTNEFLNPENFLGQTFELSTRKIIKN